MKVALCQINTTVGDFKGNVAKILRFMDLAGKQKAKLAVFPELTLFGYPPRDLLDKPFLIEQNIAAAKTIAEKTSKNFGILFGYAARNTSRGRGLFNMAALAYGGKIRFEQAKTLLPTYDVFDEARHFDPAPEQRIHDFQGHRLGLTICEDLWSEFNFGGNRTYSLDPLRALKNLGAEIVFNISASPFAAGKQKVRRELFARRVLQNKIPLVYCNLVGGNDELVFDGRSLIFSAEGKIAFEGKPFREEMAVVDLEDLRPMEKPPTLPEIEEVFHALVLGLKDYARKCSFKKVIIGLSGGIDSAVVASLAAKALGPKNVLGVAMPSPYSSKESLNDAKALAKRLEIPFRVYPIHKIYLEYLKRLSLDIRKGVSLTAENIQARIRGTILMALSNKTGAFVLSTGNKSELACGYCTLYGDMAGGLAILSDLPKTSVYALARFINRRKMTIPESILRKAPSAELKPNQKDEDSLPPYPILDAILKSYIEEHKSASEIIRQGIPKKMVLDVLWLVNNNEYKRRQAPPGIKVTSKAFGMGRRFPIAWKSQIS